MVLIDSSWLDEIIKPHNKSYTVGSYGYHIWSDTYTYKDFDLPFYFGLGYGGQYLINIPMVSLSIILTSRIYKDSILPLNLIKTVLLNQIIENIIEN